MSNVYRNDEAAIAASIVQLYIDAEIDPDSLPHTITPLHRLIGAFNLRMEELANLSYQSAKHFLEIETRTETHMEDSLHDLAGFLYVRRVVEHDYGCILIRSDDPVIRRRFTAAHELGHYLLHFRQALAYSTNPNEALILSEGITYDTTVTNRDIEELPAGELQFMRDTRPEVFTDDVLKRMEREANQFAAELLMPANKCHTLFERFQHNFSEKPSVLVGRLASEFLVSREAMGWRLKNLGLVIASPSL